MLRSLGKAALLALVLGVSIGLSACLVVIAVVRRWTRPHGGQHPNV